MMYDPLVWWYGQRCAGNKYLAMTQMALDVLSIPGKSLAFNLMFNSLMGER
jgi:hypothetical protein